MRHRPLSACLLVVTVMVLAAPARAQQKPFTQEQIQGLVRDGLGDDTGARLVAQRGIDFALTDEFLQLLKTAGASDAFIQALRAARSPQPPPSSGGGAKPLNEIQIISLVSGNVPNHRVASLVQERGIDFDPTDDYFRQLRNSGGDDELVAALKAATITKPVTVDTAAQARQAQVKEHNSKAAQALRNKRFDEAESEYRAAIQLDPQNPDLHISLGYTLGLKNDWDGEITEQREAIRLNPNNDNAHLDLGVALSNKDDQDGAIAEYREAIRINPNNDQAHFNLGNRLSHKDNWEAAVPEYRAAVRLDPKNAPWHTTLGLALTHLKDWSGAVAEYRESIRLNPNDEDTHLDLGVALSQLDDQDGAIAEYREAIRLNPKDEQAHINLGNRLSYRKDYDGAAAEYGEAVRLNSNNHLAHYLLGTAYEHKGDRQGAWEQYRTAYQMDPKDDTYKQAYDRMAAQINR